MFEWSARSLKQLETVKPELKQVCDLALKLTPIDFAVIEGRRSKEREEELFKEGKTKTLESKHLPDEKDNLGKAVDIFIKNGSINDYCAVALAFKEASRQLNIPIRWGGSWAVLTELTITLKKSIENYEEYCALHHKTPLIDLGHFELHNEEHK